MIKNTTLSAAGAVNPRESLRVRKKAVKGVCRLRVQKRIQMDSESDAVLDAEQRPGSFPPLRNYRHELAWTALDGLGRFATFQLVSMFIEFWTDWTAWTAGLLFRKRDSIE